MPNIFLLTPQVYPLFSQRSTGEDEFFLIKGLGTLKKLDKARGGDLVEYFMKSKLKELVFLLDFK